MQDQTDNSDQEYILTVPTPVILDEVASGFASGFASASSFCDSWNASASLVLLVTKQNETPWSQIFSRSL